MDDPYNLARFVTAQQGVYGRVLAELTAGRKQSHWMWFVFPQLQGLGSSPTARHYAIGSLEEARAYLAHPLLGARLRECAAIVNRLEGTSARALFGYPDDLKFRSCMTLFLHAAGEQGAQARPRERPRSSAPADLFAECLRKYFGGDEDALTRERLGLGAS